MDSNFTLRDEIREYWSLRAEHFDAAPGHGIRAGNEKQAWLRMLRRQLGEPNGRHTLDLACGTGEITHLMHDFGLRVTGLDWSDTMLALARKKAEDRSSGIKFLTGDAENTREPAGSYDVITMRHLVWTLVDPNAAFKHWFELLKRGGTVLIVDGDFTNKSPLQRFLMWLAARTGNAHDHNSTEAMKVTHKSLHSRVYFSDGASPGRIADMLRDVGFQEISVTTNLSEISRAQAKEMGLIKGLARVVSSRYIIRAIKPA